MAVVIDFNGRAVRAFRCIFNAGTSQVDGPLRTREVPINTFKIKNICHKHLIKQFIEIFMAFH